MPVTVVTREREELQTRHIDNKPFIIYLPLIKLAKRFYTDICIFSRQLSADNHFLLDENRY